MIEEFSPTPEQMAYIQGIEDEGFRDYYLDSLNNNLVVYTEEHGEPQTDDEHTRAVASSILWIRSDISKEILTAFNKHAINPLPFLNWYYNYSHSESEAT